MRFKKTNKLVTQILEDYPQTRNSDNLLYLMVIDSIGKGNSDKPISTILMNLEDRIDEMYRQLETAKSKKKRHDLRRGIDRAEKERRKRKKGDTILL